MNQIQYTGTGSASGAKTASTTSITVLPSTTYILSGWIDATHVTLGSPEWVVMNTTMTTAYGSVSQTAGVKGRVQGSVSIPSGVTAVVIVANSNNCTVASGQVLAWTAAQLEQNTSSGLATAYKPNAFDDSIGAIALGAHAPQVRNTIASVADASGSYLAGGTVNSGQINPKVLNISHFQGDTSGDTTTNIFNGSTKQLTQAVHDPTVVLGAVSGTQRNMCPDSDMKFGNAYWTCTSAMQIAVAG